MSDSQRRLLRWSMTIVGAILIIMTVAISVYARFGGEAVHGTASVAQGRSFLVANGGIAHCKLKEPSGTRSLEVRPPGTRGSLSGTRISTTTGGQLTCSGGDVRLTSGPMLSLYPMAEYAYIPVILGALLIVLPRFVITAKRRTK